jgi:hypothetical protein
MFRVPLLCLAIFAAAWLEFTVFPGHSYLEGDTQLYLPMLERMDAPGLLSRDMVATNPTLSLTAYDEATLLLHEAGRQPFHRALLAQQLVFRVAALFGIFLLARATGLSHLFAFTVTAIVNLGATVAGPAVFLTDREPLPGPFAFALVLLAMGLLSRDLPLLAAVAGGLAFLYDPMLAGPFWCVLLLAFWFDRGMRVLVRPMLPVFLVFVLLLANLAQLQPGTAAEPFLTHISASLALFQQRYAPHLYVGLWPSGELLQIFALTVFGLWAAVRCHSILSGCFRWLVFGTGLCGLLSIPFSYVLTDESRLLWTARLQPTRTLLFTAAACALLFGLAGMHAILQRFPWEALGWFLLLFMLSVSHGLFDLRLTETNRLSAFALALALAALLTGLLLRFATGTARFVTLAAPLSAAVALAFLPGLRSQSELNHYVLGDLAKWADASTWGSSIFLFPDAGRATYPSVFRAQSRHALWVDWKSAQGVIYSDSWAASWQERWRNTMQDGFSTTKLESLLPLPIDYYVLRRENQLIGARLAFSNRDFVVYDAEDLRNAPKPLRVNTRAAH